MARRNFLKTLSLGSLATFLWPGGSSAFTADESFHSMYLKDTSLIITDLKVHIVKVNQRGNWVLVELLTNKGIKGVGEASHGRLTREGEGQITIEEQLKTFFQLVKGTSPFNIEQYRQRAWEKARPDRTSHTAFSAIEQALWDIKGKVLGVPVYQLLGGKVRDKVKAYANINRATNEKDANGRRPAVAFQKNAELALKQGFNAIKMAPFDEMKPLPSTREQISADIDHALHCIEEVRKTIGNDIDLLVDVHSHLDQSLGIEVAGRVEPYNLFWLEECVNPEKYVAETKAITDSTVRTTAGGESVFGREGFAPLIQAKALDILMPDVKHCGGIQELKYIAAMAEAAGIKVAPHNPSGPVATAASVQAVASIPNFTILEVACGEVPWRSELTTPEEQFSEGYITVSDQPGFGFALNQKEIAKHS